LSARGAIYPVFLSWSCSALLILGVIFLFMTVIGAFLLQNPPAGLVAKNVPATPA